MKKASAILMALLMAVPAMVQPVCAMACGGEAAAGRVSCCCGTQAAASEGLPAFTAPPCCPTDSPRSGVVSPDSVVSTGEALRHAGGVAPANAAVLLAAAELVPVTMHLNPVFSGRALSTGPPIFLAVSSLRC